MSRDMTLVHPRLQEKVELLKKRFPKIGFSDGMRTKAVQDTLYAQGRTKAGKIVTNVKYPNSQHNWGIAVDFFHNQVGNLYPLSFMNEVGSYAKSIGLGWGGDWTSFVDRPHLYLPDWGSTTSKLASQYKTPAEFQKTWGNIKVTPTSPPAPTPGKPTTPITPKPAVPASNYTVGRVYTTQVSALNVRTGAGTNFAKKSKSQLSADGRKNSNASGQLNKGVKVTCQQVAKDSAGNTWIRIPSGWICAVWKGSPYVL